MGKVVGGKAFLYYHINSTRKMTLGIWGEMTLLVDENASDTGQSSIDQVWPDDNFDIRLCKAQTLDSSPFIEVTFDIYVTHWWGRHQQNYASIQLLRDTSFLTPSCVTVTIVVVASVLSTESENNGGV